MYTQKRVKNALNAENTISTQQFAIVKIVVSQKPPLTHILRYFQARNMEFFLPFFHAILRSFFTVYTLIYSESSSCV